jgi:hypothetical protein
MRKISIFFATAILFFGCDDRYIRCGEDSNRGIIVKDVSFGNSCLSYLVDQYFVIDNQSELDSLYLCDGCAESDPYPSIDFSEYTLLGVYASGGGCDIQFIRRVEERPDAGKYTYTIEVRECGMCDMLRYSMNWVLVPKLPDGWMVEFSIEHTK